MSKRARRFLRDETAKQVRRRRPRHPPGLAPGVRVGEDGTGTAVVAVPAGQDPCWEELLKRFGFGGCLDVLDVVEVRSWEVFSGEHGTQQLHYVKAKVRRRAAAQDRVDVEQLCEWIQSHEPGPARPEGTGARVVALSDWQLGKRDGDGVVGTVERAMASIDRVSQLLRDDPVEELLVCGMGDLIEGCDGHYAMQAFQAELNRREQCRAARRLIVRALRDWAPLVPSMRVRCVPGNHGEVRRGGKAYTDWGDNDDVAVFEQAAEVLAANEAFSHVKVELPGKELTQTVKVGGLVLGLAHGHQVKSANGDAILKWWQRTMLSRALPIHDADILLTAHFHCLRVADLGDRAWIQCPTIEGGSQWWEEQGGCSSRKGQLTFKVTDGVWHGLEVV